MKWKKLGKIFDFVPVNNYLLTHASNPLAVHLNDDVFRIFFSSRDINNRSSIGYVDLNIFSKKVYFQSNVLFKYGDFNSFFSHGVSIGNIYHINDDSYILFMGWQANDNQHWRGDIGRLRLKNNEKLYLDPESVFIGCDTEDKISLSYPWVLYDEGIYKMWYGSTIDWHSKNGEMVHVIKYSTSNDGETWLKHGTAIPYEIGKAQAFSRPSVIKDNNGYHMWFSFRSGNGTPYRIGYAHSCDGLQWNRFEHSGIDVSSNGWDKEMICYPFVFDHKGSRYMLYNGNSYGKTGFGLAVLDQD